MPISSSASKTSWAALRNPERFALPGRRPLERDPTSPRPGPRPLAQRITCGTRLAITQCAQGIVSWIRPFMPGAILRSATSAQAARLFAAIPDAFLITGQLFDIHGGTWLGGNGSFSYTKNGGLSYQATEGTFCYGNFTFDASKSSSLFGASTTNQVSSLRGYWLIRF